jgi:hypothetical protein
MREWRCNWRKEKGVLEIMEGRMTKQLTAESLGESSETRGLLLIMSIGD